MYPLPTDQLSLLDDFYLPFSGKLSADNRWVQLASVIPWDVIEQRYASLFAEGQGAPAKPVRMALGRLLSKKSVDFHIGIRLSRSGKIRIFSSSLD